MKDQPTPGDVTKIVEVTRGKVQRPSRGVRASACSSLTPWRLGPTPLNCRDPYGMDAPFQAGISRYRGGRQCHLICSRAL